MKKQEIAVSRIAITPSNYEALKEFKNGLDASFDEAIEVLLDCIKERGEDSYTAGKRLKKEFSKEK